MYLPAPNTDYVFLTWAQSLNGRIGYTYSQGKPNPGQLVLSGHESFVMTHKLRAHADGIMVGSTTVRVDNPSLTARLPDPAHDTLPLDQQPRPILVDSSLSLDYESLKVIKLARLGVGKAPYVIVSPKTESAAKSDPIIEQKVNVITRVGGKLIVRATDNTVRFHEYVALDQLRELGIRRLMVEGGARLLSHALKSECVDAAIVTISPQFVDPLSTIGIDAPSLNWPCKSWEMFGDDVVFEGRRR
ncbi:5-amino-6-(5-phosphoribosylamino) uracil reductase [Schizosaccharomyces japonicus yFS275]|uniref:2,5-diamino-6-ribosylamino-4(3H)-pyrimidinone 5'-phosphate reductase n=1 Tax=Schizosaccharomyces japonicus (strain yFS275 / FY16936) TaxID=402676 RepID=B6JVS5_SCHJY|nr:5-amino-6-(5-phosphoribosylamino) uracil reductase [Schizosaccharomyces japonicus yFS275]EEB05476.1 5-amino-6-(5-phosphoribosylamino) uracil reductase [Schizosaccharomyces japonicus yFS275]